MEAPPRFVFGADHPKWPSLPYFWAGRSGFSMGPSWGRPKKVLETFWCRLLWPFGEVIFRLHACRESPTSSCRHRFCRDEPWTCGLRAAEVCRTIENKSCISSQEFLAQQLRLPTFRTIWQSFCFWRWIRWQSLPSTYLQKVQKCLNDPSKSSSWSIPASVRSQPWIWTLPLMSSEGTSSERADVSQKPRQCLQDKPSELADSRWQE